MEAAADEEEVKVKIEAASPALTDKLDILDKWRARVLLEEVNEEAASQAEGRDVAAGGWTRKIERRMAVLRVAFPFLTEKQIRGKAWESCGLNSVMGGIPRAGLSPKIKKEFTKASQKRYKVPRRIRIKKEDIKEENCPYVFPSPLPQQDEPTDLSTNYDSKSPIPISQFSNVLPDNNDDQYFAMFF